MKAAQEKPPAENEVLRYSVSLVTQGKHRFYTLTMPSDVLAKTCFVTTRDEDPIQGFQRVLDAERAKQIAEYIDNGFGTIPSSIVLSAQPEAQLKIIGSGKTLEFRNTNKAFLVLDGQHRVFGFSLAKTALRVPVVIYNNLTRQEESRLFIDINTKQRPVPNELLLDIKHLAEYETDTEQLLRELFDLFNSDVQSPLLGLMSPAAQVSKKVSRVTFNAGVKPLIPTFGGKEAREIYTALSAYLQSFMLGADGLKASQQLTNPTVFRAAMMLFPEVAQRLQDRFGTEYSGDHFYQIMEPMFARLKSSFLIRPGNSSKVLYDAMLKALKTGFTL